jgi:outer membrane protein assembly factor BamA
MLKHNFITLIFSIFFFSSIAYSQSYYDYELTSIEFNGNETFPKSELIKIIDSKESPMWFWVFLNSFTPFGDQAVYFDSSKVSIDKIALKEFYKANGFFKAKISSQIQVDNEAKEIRLIYDIKENKPFYFGKVTIDGLGNLSSYDFDRLRNESITIDSTKRYSEVEAQQDINSIKRYLANNGYVVAHYDSTVITIDTLHYRTDLSFYFRSGNKYTVSNVIISKSGASIEQITNQLIDEIVGIKPGTIYDQSVVDRSELRLLKTELFTSVNVNPVLSDTTNNKIPIEVNCAIGSLNGLSPEIKADNEFNSFNTGLGISYTRKNFFGDARKLTLSTSFRLIDITNFNFGNLFKSADKRDSTFQGVLDLNLKMEQPYFFGKPILTSTEVYYRSQSLTGLTLQSYGGAQKFDFEMPYYTFLTLLRPSITLDVTRQEAANTTTKSLTPGIGLELGSSKTNDIQFPTQGYFLFLTPEIFQSTTKILGEKSEEGSTYFYRIQTGFSHYISTNYFKTSVFASKIRVGYIQPFYGSNNNSISASKLIPPNKTFYAGGSNSVRGWRARELVPKDSVEYAGITVESNDIRGGTFWLEGSFEYRRKLNQYFGFAIFTDYGNTWNSWRNVALKGFAVSVGGGIRIYTPIAPFRLDFGTKFYNPFDESFIFDKVFLRNIEIHFGIGEAF